MLITTFLEYLLDNRAAFPIVYNHLLNYSFEKGYIFAIVEFNISFLVLGDDWLHLLTISWGVKVMLILK